VPPSCDVDDCRPAALLAICFVLESRRNQPSPSDRTPPHTNGAVSPYPHPRTPFFIRRSSDDTIVVNERQAECILRACVCLAPYEVILYYASGPMTSPEKLSRVVRCEHCQFTVNTSAIKCPHCGNIRRRALRPIIGIIGFASALLILGGLGAVYFSDDVEGWGLVTFGLSALIAGAIGLSRGLAKRPRMSFPKFFFGSLFFTLVLSVVTPIVVMHLTLRGVGGNCHRHYQCASSLSCVSGTCQVLNADERCGIPGCRDPAFGFCHLRAIRVCEQHRQFVDAEGKYGPAGRTWLCP
jgi:hypothetical protein